MKLDVISKENKVTSKVELPPQFNEEVRKDLIKRAVLVLQSNARQRYGANPEAGKRASVRISKRRHDYRGTYGIGQSRTPRKVMNYRGTRFSWTGAFAPQTVGGRKAHPPKSSKGWEKKINIKERLKAIRSALAATVDKELVKAHGYKIPDNYPFAIDESFEKLAKTKDVKDALVAVGFGEDLQRASERKIRAGKGKNRGRAHKNKTSVLIVTADECPLLKAAQNIPGVQTATYNQLNTELLAPGTQPGRVTLYTQNALHKIEETKIFTQKAVAKPTKATTKAEVSA